MSFPALGATGADILPAAAQQTPKSPTLGSAADGNWIQESTDQNPDHDHRQDSEQGPLQKLAMDEERKSLRIPQL